MFSTAQDAIRLTSADYGARSRPQQTLLNERQERVTTSIAEKKRSDELRNSYSPEMSYGRREKVIVNNLL